MASSPQSYQKRQRELRKKERKAEKQAIRHGRSAAKKEQDDDEGPRKAEIFHKMGLGEAPEPREPETEDVEA